MSHKRHSEKFKKTVLSDFFEKGLSRKAISKKTGFSYNVIEGIVRRGRDKFLDRELEKFYNDMPDFESTGNEEIDKYITEIAYLKAYNKELEVLIKKEGLLKKKKNIKS